VKVGENLQPRHASWKESEAETRLQSAGTKVPVGDSLSPTYDGDVEHEIAALSVVSGRKGHRIAVQASALR
jgi:hypothetical protein